MADVKKALTKLTRAAEIIEVGDQRLMAGDGPCGGMPPDISLTEWREMYLCIVAAIKVLRDE